MRNCGAKSGIIYMRRGWWSGEYAEYKPICFAWMCWYLRLFVVK